MRFYFVFYLHFKGEIMSKYLFLSIFFISGLFGEDFVVGTTSGYAPYVSLDEEGKYVGFDIDFAEALAKKLDRTLVIKDLGSMPSLFLALKLGKIDAIIWAISITQERQKVVEMVYYQGEKVTQLPMLFWKTIPDNVRRPEDLANNPKAVVCVEAGSFQEGVLQKVEGLKVKQVDKVMDAILELKFSKACATMIDPSLLSRYKAQFPELKVLDVALAPSQQSLGNGICLSKDNSPLSHDVQQAVEALQNEGQIRLLEEKWGLVAK